MARQLFPKIARQLPWPWISPVRLALRSAPGFQDEPTKGRHSNKRGYQAGRRATSSNALPGAPLLPPWRQARVAVKVSEIWLCIDGLGRATTLQQLRMPAAAIADQSRIHFTRWEMGSTADFLMVEERAIYCLPCPNRLVLVVLLGTSGLGHYGAIPIDSLVTIRLGRLVYLDKGVALLKQRPGVSAKWRSG